MPWYLVKALLLGTENTILYDPQGVIREKRDELRQDTTYGEFLAPMVASALNEISEQLTIAIWQEEEGQFLNAWNELIPWATGYLFYIICDFTARKRFEEAVQDIGIPELAEHILEICRLKCAVNGYTSEYVNQLYEVGCAHWEYQIQHVWEPLKQHLVAQGVQSPDSLTVKGELVLPYGGERLYELGRALIEHSFSLDWAKALMEQGDILEAIDKIRYEDIITNADEKWRRIDNAITDAGYHWAVTIDGKIKTGNYAYKLGSHVFIYPSDGTYFTPEGCWIAAWNQDIDEVCGFTFSPNCGCIIARGGSTDFGFYLPVGDSTVRFHVIKPKPCPPYLALQEWAYSEQPIPLAKGGAEPRSPYINHTQD